MSLLEIFISFIKIGSFSFGGGYGMLRMLNEECIDKHGWIDQDDLSYILLIAEATPGSVAINCATYVGYKRAKVWGSIIATIGVILPSFIIIFAISLFLNNFMDIIWVQNALKGIQIVVCLLIFDATYTMVKKIKKTILNWLIFLSSALAMLLISIFSWNFSSVYIILISAMLSLSVYSTSEWLKNRKTNMGA